MRPRGTLALWLSLAATTWTGAAACGGDDDGDDGLVWPADSAPASDAPRSDGGVATDGATGDAAPTIDSAPQPYEGNYMFVTSALYTPTEIASAANADALCQAAAAAGDPRLAGRTYMAWVSDATSDAIDRLGDANGWLRLDGKPFALAADGLIASTHIHYPGSIDENGVDLRADANAMENLWVFTGTRPYTGKFAAAINDEHPVCDNWASTSEDYTASAGDASASAYAYTEAGSLPCDRTGRLYCLGTDYQDPLEPLPTPTDDQRYVFGVRTPLIPGGRDALDQACQDAADEAGVAGTFLALIASGDDTASSRFSAAGGPWVRPDGVVAIPDPAGFLAGGLPEAMLGLTFDFKMSALLTAVGSRAQNGATDTNPETDSDCTEWTTDHAAGARVGRTAFTTSIFWDSKVRMFCDSDEVAIYCLEP